MTRHLSTIFLVLVFTFMFTTSKGQAKSNNMNKEDKVEVQVVSLLADSSQKDNYLLTFHVVGDSSRALVMQIGYQEAQVLTITLEEMKPAAPLPLDLLQNAFMEFGYTIKEVFIDGLKD